MTGNWLLLSYLALMGSCLGSFLNVVIYRLPRGQSLVSPGSRCPQCGYALRWYDNLPVVSWTLLGGRCRQCHASISAQYPMVETITALLFVLVAWLTPVGPLLVKALVAQDMFLAGTIVLLLGVMTVVGTFISDLVRMWVDPRIRHQMD